MGAQGVQYLVNALQGNSVIQMLHLSIRYPFLMLITDTYNVNPSV
jgi:hypothetical protein